MPYLELLLNALYSNLVFSWEKTHFDRIFGV